MELEDRIQSMLLEKDKIITDYDNYIDNLMIEKEKLKGMETLVRKLEQEKAYLEEEIEKVRMIKLMLENQLSAYSENTEIRRLRSDNERLTGELRRIKNTIATELGYTEDPTRLDMQTVVTQLRSHFQTNINSQSGIHELQKRNEELEDKLRYATNDNNAELATMRKTLRSLEDENQRLKYQLVEVQNDKGLAQGDIKRRMTNLETENERLKNTLSNLKNTVNVGNGNNSEHTTEINILQQKIRTLEGSPNGQMMAQIAHLQNELSLANEKVRRESERNTQLEERQQLMNMNPPLPGTQSYYVTETKKVTTNAGPSAPQNAAFNQRSYQ